MGRCVPLARLLLALGLALLLTTPLRALEVKEIRWGFHGRFVMGVFNPVTVTLHNDSEEPFDGPVKLQLEMGFKPNVGAPLEQSLFLSPGATKRVQFFPHVRSSHEIWRLVWGLTPAEQFRPDDPVPLAHRAQIALRPRHVTVVASEGVRVFPEELFPHSVAGLDALAELLVVDDPEWDPRQEQALLDWLRGGGVLHLADGEGGSRLLFDGKLEVLNGIGTSAQVGAGYLVRHAALAGALDVDRLGWDRESTLTRVETDELEQPQLDLDLHVIERLGQLSEADHNWGVIYLLSFLYLALVVPVNMVIGKRVRDYRIAILFLLTCVVVFSFVMHMVGKRGYGETARVYSVVCAEVIGGGRYDLSRWAHAFVTSSDEYSFTQGVPGHLYGTVRRTEKVIGVVRNEGDGEFLCDMPLYSSREFIQRGPIDGQQFIEGVIAGDPMRSRAIEITVGPGFPQNAHGIWLHAYDYKTGRDRLRRMALKDGVLRESGPAADAAYSGPLNPYSSRDLTRREGWREDHLASLARSVVGQRAGILETRKPAGHGGFRPVHLLVHADLPEAFKVQGEIGESGHVVYHQVLEFNDE